MATAIDWRAMLEGRSQVQTKRALLIIDMQNDFLSPGGALPMQFGDMFVPCLEDLVQTFRQIDSRIFWVRTELEPKSDLPPRRRRSSAKASEPIMLGVNTVPAGQQSDELEPTLLTATQNLSDPVMVAPNTAVPPDTKQPSSILKKKTSAASRTRSLLDRISGRKKQNLIAEPPAPSEHRLATTEASTVSASALRSTSSEDEGNADDLSVEEGRKDRPICVRGTWGARIADCIHESYNPKLDLDLTKQRDSAFLDTELLHELRTNMVSELFICGCGSNTTISDTVASAVQNGLIVTVVEDCIAYKSSIQHAREIQYLSDSFGAQICESSDIITDLRKAHISKPGSSARSTEAKELKSRGDVPEGTRSPSDEVEKIMTTLEMLSITGPGIEARSDVDSDDEGSPLDELADRDISFALAKDGYCKRGPSEGRNSQRSSVGHQEEVRGPVGSMSSRVTPPRSSGEHANQMQRQGRLKHQGPGRSRADQGAPRQRQPKLSALEHHEENTARMMPGSTAALKDTALQPKNMTLDDNRAQPQADSQKQLAGLSTTINLTDSGDNEASSHKSIMEAHKLLEVSHSPTDGRENNVVVPTMSSRPAQSFDPTTAISVPSTDQSKKAKPRKKKKKSKTLDLSNFSGLGPDDMLGEGDSCIIYNFISATPQFGSALGPVSKKIFELIRKEVNWQKMHHNEGEVPRLVAVQGIIDEEDQSYPIYRHPSDQSPPVNALTRYVSECLLRAQDLGGHPLNHVLIQLYRSGEDNISEHSDKTLDIVPDSHIVNVSFGAQRTMRLRTKRPNITAEEPDDESLAKQQSRITQRIPMPHNSMFVLGAKTNGAWLHGIQPDKRRAEERSPAELAYGGERISLTFRHIGTFLSADQKLIWGQGARGKTKADARYVVNGDEAESRKLIDAFGRENREGPGGWREWYGEGSDVLHFKMEKTERGSETVALASASGA